MRIEKLINILTDIKNEHGNLELAYENTHGVMEGVSFDDPDDETFEVRLVFQSFKDDCPTYVKISQK